LLGGGEKKNKKKQLCHERVLLQASHGGSRLTQGTMQNLMSVGKRELPGGGRIPHGVRKEGKYRKRGVGRVVGHAQHENDMM